MIETVLNQAQKLFGRGFLIAAFVPSAIAVAASAALLHGLGTLGRLVNAWAQQPAKAVFQIGLTLIGVYLLAYVLYGIRGGINRIYQGSLPRPLKTVLRRNQARSLRRALRDLARTEAAMDDAIWPTEDFPPTWVQKELSDKEATVWLQEAAQEHNALLRTLNQRKKIDDEDYRRLLQCARTLQSRAHNAATPSPAAVRQLVDGMRQAYKHYEALAVATQRINARAMQDWTLAQGEFTSRFPESERWLRPTRLGNMTAALDYAVLKRYEISLSTLWPRLLHVVADDVRDRVEDANIYLDFILMMSFLSVATSGVALTTVAIGPDRSRALQALLVVAPLFGWWLFYRLAMGATRAFADHIRAAVDLFRLDLLDALSIERPDTPADEQPIWRAIDAFIIQGDVPGPSVRFVKSNETPSQPSSGLIDLLGDLWRRAPLR